jgi:folate-binding protein YgfZ
MPNLLRSSRALFRFSGPDATKLLSDVLTGRLLEERGSTAWWALLSPQGKIQAEGLSSWVDGAFWLDVNAAVADEFHRRMRLYRLRAKVDIEVVSASHLVGWSNEGEGVPDARGIGNRLIVPADQRSEWSKDEAPFHAARIACGVPELGADFDPDSAFPHDIGMDLLGGVDFAKGCYIGQEVVSRMQHRGTARRRPVIVSALPDGTARGTPVMVGDREAGPVGLPLNGKAVAILRLDRVPDENAATVAGQQVRLTIPSWGKYGFGQSGTSE